MAISFSQLIKEYLYVIKNNKGKLVDESNT